MLSPAGSWSNSCSLLLATKGQSWLVCDKRKLFMQYVWNTDCTLYFETIRGRHAHERRKEIKM